MLAQLSQSHNLSDSTIAVWAYLTDIQVRHEACPRYGIRPKVQTIAKAVRRSRRTIFYALRRLEECGILRRTARYRDNGEQASSWYFLERLYRRVPNPQPDELELPAPDEAPRNDAVANDDPAAPRHDCTPLEESPCGRYHSTYQKDPLRDRAKGHPIQRLELPPWDATLDDAYDRYIWDPIAYRDTMRMYTRCAKHEAFVKYLTDNIPDGCHWSQVLEHIIARLADLAPDDTTGIRRPQYWIRGYLERLRSQGVIQKGARRFS